MRDGFEGRRVRADPQELLRFDHGAGILVSRCHQHVAEGRDGALITDPCCWRFRVKDEISGEMVTQGLVCAHVDDFIVVGNEGCEEWVDALTQFYHRYDWSDWEFGSFSHCGVILKENKDLSVTLDHASFVDNLEPVEFQNRDEKEQVTEFERPDQRFTWRTSVAVL